MPNPSFHCKPFDQLSLEELYAVMRLRQEVFVVEQTCPYLDADGKDAQSWHLMGFSTIGRLEAYARLLPVGVSYPDYPSIGRILTHPSRRGQGLGRVLMERSIQEMKRLFGSGPIKIQAQVYLEKFYASYGFSPVGKPYLEDDIPHVDMVAPEPIIPQR